MSRFFWLYILFINICYHISMKKLNFIDLFSGCGGMSLGLEMAGFNPVLAIDNWDKCLETIKLNNQNIETMCKGVNDFSEQELLALKDRLPKIDCIAGGPPCQGFSLAGKRNINDPRNELWKSYFKFIEIFNPDYFIMENVFGIESMINEKGEKIIDKIKATIEKLGYTYTINKVNTKYFGIPQERKRIIIIGCKEKKNIILKPNNLIKTLRDAIGDLESLQSGEKSKKDKYHFASIHNENHIKWLTPVPEGQSAHDYKHLTGMNVKGYSTTYKRIWWDRPSPAVTTCFDSISSQNNVHPRDTRALTIREAMRIQTFPDNFEFFGSKKDICKQIGNAVPPILGKIIGEAIIDGGVKINLNMFNFIYEKQQ